MNLSQSIKASGIQNFLDKSFLSIHLLFGPDDDIDAIDVRERIEQFFE